ncbi:aldehyde dehydrogenase family protein, partial [Enterococcus lactis]|uniref:aldehyde dehydrogenase family protein n=1 Tax=Enterococcus lactis TaxID=357441 RepID=UPI003907EC76
MAGAHQRCRRGSRGRARKLGRLGRATPRQPPRTLRRFANMVRAKLDPFADLIARETGKPLWEAKTEVESVIA